MYGDESGDVPLILVRFADGADLSSTHPKLIQSAREQLFPTRNTGVKGKGTGTGGKKLRAGEAGVEEGGGVQESEMGDKGDKEDVCEAPGQLIHCSDKEIAYAVEMLEGNSRLLAQPYLKDWAKRSTLNSNSSSSNGPRTCGFFKASFLRPPLAPAFPSTVTKKVHEDGKQKHKVRTILFLL
jgi:hypothetical protein